ncbi:MAG TPA: carboxypeptidase regulatory-like domain-containing protein, partial [Vicinamibacterales bacterium]|nr:carboxypeptidase regulatory-like domain-containing protein [Vicinamibacterales bacterium]
SASGPVLISASVVGPETLEAAGPFGFNVALLFDRVVSDTAAADIAQYSIPNNQMLSARRQLSGRLVFGSLAQPEGPYVPTSIAVSGMLDPRGMGVGPQSAPLQSLLTFPGAVISGRVINSEGQLAAGIRVIYNGDANWKDCQTPLPIRFTQAITDASGRYQFRYVMRHPCGGGWTMEARDDLKQSFRRVSGSVRSPGERVTADIALLGRGGVTGIVRDINSKPVPDAQVIAVSTLEPAIGGATRTDGDGRFSIGNITVGPVSVKAAKGSSVGTSAGQIARAGTNAAVDVTLNSGTVSVSGIVKKVEGGIATPAADAIVIFEAPDPLGNNGFVVAGAMRTGADGSYSLADLPAGPYYIRATLATGDTAALNGVSTAGDAITGRDILIPITRNARVSGVVRYADGSPAPYPVVTLSSVGTVGEQDGTFVIENAKVSAQAQAIVAYSGDGLRQGSTKVLLNQSGQQLSNVVVTLNGIGTLDLVVLDPLGQPIRNQIVQIARTGHNISPNDCTAFYLAPTDDFGRVQFAGLEVGTVRVVSIRATANGVDIAKLDTTIPYEGAEVFGVLRFGGGGVIRGTIRDDQNTPVFGANIEVFSKKYNSGSCALEAGISHRLRTNLNGEYRVTGVPVGSVSVSASQEFFPTPVGASRVLARDGDELVIDLKLIHTIAGKVSGKVLLPDGVTPAGAGVTLSAIGALPEVLVSTNANGEYAFPKIFPAGGLTVTVRDPATGYVAQERLSVAAGQDLQHNFRLKGRGTVRVTVVDGAGVPVTNALVTLQESEFPNEKFEAVVEPSNEGVVTFANVHDGDFNVSASDVFARGGRVSGELPGNGATVDATVRLTVTGTVTGRFLMPDGTPIAFGTVKLMANNRVIGQTATASGDDPGAFTFTYVPAGTVRLEGLDPATGRSGIAIGQLTTDGQTVTLDVRAVGLGTVTGRITSNGEPQNGATVTVASGTFKATANADGGGFYHIPGVPEGTINVTADLGGALRSTAAGTLLGDGGAVTIDVALVASGTVVGVVTAADGSAAPPSIATITIGNSRYTTTTNDLGEYRFDLIPAGSRTVTVDVIGSTDTTSGTVAVTGGQTSTLPLQLIGLGTIAGTAQSANGTPVNGTVTLTGSGPVSWSTTLTVAGDGSFTAAQVLAGPFTAQVRNTVGNITLFGTATGVVTPYATTNIVVTLQATGTIRGTVLRADGTTPAIGATVTLRSGTVIKGARQAFTDGSFAFEGLPLGTYSVTVYDFTTDGYARSLDLVLAANGDDRNTGVLVLDAGAPVVESILPADGAIGVSRTQPIVVTFSDPLQGTSGVNLKNNGVSVANSRSLSADGRVLTMTGTWPDSSALTIEVTTAVEDVYGRHLVATVTSGFVTVDTTAPVVTAVSPLHDAYQVAVGASIVATFSEPIANTSVQGLLTVSRSGLVVAGTAFVGPANVVTFTPASPLSDNAIYTVTVDGAVDASGNEQGAASVTTFATTDTVPPVLTITTPSLTGWITDSTPTITVARSDATSGVTNASGTLAIDGVAVTPNNGTSITYTVPAASSLADGTHTIAATTADRAGNVGQVSGSFMLDATDPAVPQILAPAAGATVAGQTTITASSTDATSGVARIEIQRNGSTILNLLPPTFSGTWNAGTTSDGAYTLTARAVDVAGNVSDFSAGTAIVVDNDPLTLTITAPVANLRTRKPVNVTATVNEPVQRVDFTLGPVTQSDTTSPFAATLSVDALPEGNATVTVTAHGLLGEVVTQQRVIIVDRTSPVARWAFDEGTGLTAADSTGNGHTATLLNGTAWSAVGQFGKAIALDGMDDGVTAPGSADFDIVNALSLSAWVLPNSSGTIQTLIEKSGTASAYSLGIGPDGRAEAIVYPNGVAVVAQSVAPLASQLWSHLAATYDGAGLKLFVNGALVATTPGAGSLPVTEGAIWLGRSETGNVLNGRLDEVRIYDRAISEAEVTALASASSSKTLLAGGFRGTWVAQPGGTAWAMGQHNLGSLGVGSPGTSTLIPTAMPVISDLANIAADNTHGLALTRAGVLYGWGSASNGVGDGTSSNRSTPVVIALDNVVQVAAGTSHSGAVLANGDAYTWGSNGNGQLGDGSTANSLVPKLVMTGVRAIAMSGNSTLFLKTNGTVWGAGVNSSGQLGNNATASTVSTPVQMQGITSAVAIALGDSHSAVLLADGTVRGAGIAGRTGDGTNTQRTTPVVVTGLNGVVQIAANGGNTLARRSDGTVWGWGSNSSGQLGDGTTTIRWAPQQVPGLVEITDIALGNDHSIAVTASGVVYTWGDNGFGELGDGTTVNRRAPMSISLENYVWKTPTPQISDLSGTFSNNRTVTVSHVLQNNVAMYYTLNGAEPTEGDTPVAHNGTVVITQTSTLSVKAFRAGTGASNLASSTYTMVVDSISINPNVTSGVSAPQSYTLNSSTAGATIHYTLDGSEPTTSSPVYSGAFLVSTQTTVKARGFRTGFTPTAVFSRTITFNFGQTSAAISPAGGTFTGSTLVTLTATPSGAAIHYTTNGSSVSSTVGGSTLLYTGPFVLARSALPLRARAFHPDYGTGAETTATFTIQATPPQFSLPPGDYPAGTKVLITGDQYATEVRYTINGSDPLATSPLVPVDGVVLGNFTIKARVFQANATQSAVVSATYSVSGQLAPAKLSAGADHTLLSTPDGRMFAFGGNFRGQVGDGGSTDRHLPYLLNETPGAIDVAAGNYFSNVLTVDGRVQVFGFNINGQLGFNGASTHRTPLLLSAPNDVIAVAAGINHSVALRSNGEAWTWGHNGDGQLANGTTTSWSAPQLVMTGVMAIAARGDHTLFVKTDGTVWAAGKNANGQLGDGTTTKRTSAVQMTGVTGAIAVAAGETFSNVLLSDGTVLSVG